MSSVVWGGLRLWHGHQADNRLLLHVSSFFFFFFFFWEGVANFIKIAHDLSVNLVKVKKNEAGETDFDIQTTEWDKLPFLTLLFKSENEVLAGGYDYNPVVFREKAGKL